VRDRFVNEGRIAPERARQRPARVPAVAEIRVTRTSRSGSRRSGSSVM